jgi:peptidoglycan-N-acetylglucosamine deacetylase
MTMRARPNSLRQRLVAPFATHRLPGCGQKSVLLTFDDGPTPGVTEGVLDRLAAASARAVFFVVGNRAADHPELIQMIHQQGHAVGNHSHTHPTSPWPWASLYWHDLRRCNQAVEAAIQTTPQFFRAPEGRIHPPSLLVPQVLKMKHILWSLDSQDWQGEDETAAKASASRVLADVENGDIILLHEYAGWIHTLLDVLLPGLKDMGFDLESGLDSLKDT